MAQKDFKVFRFNSFINELLLGLTMYPFLSFYLNVYVSMNLCIYVSINLYIYITIYPSMLYMKDIYSKVFKKINCCLRLGVLWENVECCILLIRGQPSLSLYLSISLSHSLSLSLSFFLSFGLCRFIYQNVYHPYIFLLINPSNKSLFLSIIFLSLSPSLSLLSHKIYKCTARLLAIICGYLFSWKKFTLKQT